MLEIKYKKDIIKIEAPAFEAVIQYSEVFS